MGRKPIERELASSDIVTWQLVPAQEAEDISRLSGTDIYVIGAILKTIQKRSLKGRIRMDTKFKGYSLGGVIEGKFKPTDLRNRYNYNKVDFGRILDWLVASGIIFPIGYYGRGIPMPLSHFSEKLYGSKEITFWFDPKTVSGALSRLRGYQSKYFLRTKRITFNTATGALSVSLLSRKKPFIRKKHPNTPTARALQVLMSNVGQVVSYQLLSAFDSDVRDLISDVRMCLGIRHSIDKIAPERSAPGRKGIAIKKVGQGYSLIEE